MDFGDSPEERPSAARCGRGWRRTTRNCPVPLRRPSYWEGQPAWHRALYYAGFFGLSWPVEYGGYGLPAVYDVIVDEELAAAAAPRVRASGIWCRASSATATTSQAALPAGDHQWPRPLVPGLQRAGRGLGPCVAADPCRTRRRRLRDHRPQDLDQLLRPRRLVLRPGPDRPRGAEAQGISAFAVRMHQPGHQATTAAR